MASAYGSDYGYGGSQSYGNGYSNGYGARSSQPSYALSDVAPDIRGVTDAGQIAQIIAEWTRRKAQFYVGVDNPTFMPFSAICQLGIQLEDGRAVTGTGFYITPNRLLTAGHNILYQGVRATAIEVRPGRAHNMSTFAPFTLHARDFLAHPQYRFV